MGKRAPRIKATVEAVIEVEDIVDSGMPQRDMIRFVVALDAAVQDWDFTLKLYEHFAKLKAQYDRESGTGGS